LLVEENAGEVRGLREPPVALNGIEQGDVTVVMLGTAASVPGKYRNVSAIYLRLRERGGLLLDCGEGTVCMYVWMDGWMDGWTDKR